MPEGCFSSLPAWTLRRGRAKAAQSGEHRAARIIEGDDRPVTTGSVHARTLRSLGASTAAALTALLGLAAPATAQLAVDQRAAGTNRPLQLAPDSPFRDPDLIYLEANEVINDEDANTLTAIGEVEGRYQDRTIRAERVDYDLNTGVVLATGDVVLIDATGDVQYADKIELSDELQAGTAANFTARLASGATTAARFVARDENGEFELYNVTYTACELCQNSEGETERPTWRLKARRVRQDDETRTVRYRDAVIELFGLPIFYSPYLAHPDPSQDRASGLLIPTLGVSESRGFTYVQPYYWAVDDYTEATITPRLYTKVNPLLEVEARRKFATGEINFAGSFTRATIFDQNGDPLDDPARFINPAQALDGAEFSAHAFVDGYFRPSEIWSWGYTVQLQTDDTYLDRYGISSGFLSSGPIERVSRRNTSQAFLAGQGDNFRVSLLAATYQGLNSRFVENANSGLVAFIDDNDDVLPTIAPRLQAEYYASDPVVGGRARFFGDMTYLTREDGNDYGRSTAGVDYSKTWIVPGGLELKPFAWGRFDAYDLETRTGTPLDFNRGIGQAGIDLRYPFIRPGKTVDLIVEPRIQITQSFGDAKLDEFIDPATGLSVLEDGSSPDLDAELLFERNKADGLDFFEEGRRIDVGAEVAARWQMNGRDSEVSLFAGRSYAENIDNRFDFGSGLRNGNSEYVAEMEFDVGGLFDGNLLARYDPVSGDVVRVDSSVRARTRYMNLSARYYRLGDQPVRQIAAGAPQEEVSGSVVLKPTRNWQAGYRFVRDLEDAVTRSQQFSFGYRDDCTVAEVFLTKRDFGSDIIRNDLEVGFRLVLATLGGVGTR